MSAQSNLWDQSVGWLNDSDTRSMGRQGAVQSANLGRLAGPYHVQTIDIEQTIAEFESFALRSSGGGHMSLAVPWKTQLSLASLQAGAQSAGGIQRLTIPTEAGSPAGNAFYNYNLYGESGSASPDPRTYLRRVFGGICANMLTRNQVEDANGDGDSWERLYPIFFHYTFFPGISLGQRYADKKIRSHNARVARGTLAADKIDVHISAVPYAVFYSNQKPATIGGMGSAALAPRNAMFQQYEVGLPMPAKFYIDVSLIGDADCELALIAALHTVHPVSGSFVWFMPVSAPYCTSPESYKVYGPSLGLAVMAAIAGGPSILYTGFSATLEQDLVINRFYDAAAQGPGSSPMVGVGRSMGIIEKVSLLPAKALLALNIGCPILMPTTSAAGKSLGGDIAAFSEKNFLNYALKIIYTPEMLENGVRLSEFKTPLFFVKTFSDVATMAAVAALQYLSTLGENVAQGITGSEAALLDRDKDYWQPLTQALADLNNPDPMTVTDATVRALGPAALNRWKSQQPEALDKRAKAKREYEQELATAAAQLGLTPADLEKKLVANAQGKLYNVNAPNVRKVKREVTYQRKAHKAETSLAKAKPDSKMAALRQKRVNLNKALYSNPSLPLSATKAAREKLLGSRSKLESGTAASLRKAHFAHSTQVEARRAAAQQRGRDLAAANAAARSATARPRRSATSLADIINRSTAHGPGFTALYQQRAADRAAALAAQAANAAQQTATQSQSSSASAASAPTRIQLD